MLEKYKENLIKVYTGVCLIASLSSLTSFLFFKQNIDSIPEYIIKPPVSEIQNINIESISDDIINFIDNSNDNEMYSDQDYQYIRGDINFKMDAARNYIMKNGLDSKFFETFTPQVESSHMPISKQNAANLSNNILLKNSFLQKKIYTKSEAAMSDLSRALQNINTTKIVAASIGAASAIAAVGFWAAWFWTFGATTPWAIGCTIVSTVCGGIYAASSIASIKYNQELSNWDKAWIALSSVLKLGNMIASICYTVFVTSAATITATSWVFPAVLSILPLTTLVIIALENFI